MSSLRSDLNLFKDFTNERMKKFNEAINNLVKNLDLKFQYQLNILRGYLDAYMSHTEEEMETANANINALIRLIRPIDLWSEKVPQYVVEKEPNMKNFYIIDDSLYTEPPGYFSDDKMEKIRSMYISEVQDHPCFIEIVNEFKSEYKLYKIALSIDEEKSRNIVKEFVRHLIKRQNDWR